jgi:site-specific DNA recombinase
MRPSSHWIEVPVPAIVDTATRDAVLAQFAKNKFSAERNTQREYLLRTLVVCGQCGWRMSARDQCADGRREGYLVYVCDHRDPLLTGRATRCTSRRVHAADLDQIVWDALVSWIQSPQMLLREIEAWRSSRSGVAQISRERARIESTVVRLDQQLDRLIDAYQRGGITVDELKARRERLEADRDAARARSEELAAFETDRHRMDRLGEDLEAFASALRAGVHELDFAGRQRLVRLLIERVVVTGDNVAIEHAIPLTGRFSQLRSGH